jgi:hypothetical protein
MKRMSATAIRDENGFEATVSAVIIYHNVDFAAKAKAMLERATYETGETLHCSIKPWRVDMLKLPPLAEAALAEAAEAHLVLLAGIQSQTLLPWLVDWLEQWAKCRQVHEAALGVWDGGDPETGSARAATELSSFAGRHGLRLIFDDNSLVGAKSSMFASDLHQREVSLTPTLQHILEQPVRDCWQHWGINE